MKISLNWLSNYIRLTHSAQEIAEGLTMGIAEVEDVVPAKNPFEGIVVGQVISIAKHPNADRLSLALVDIGEKKLKIICGASNLKAGQKVPVATIGSVLPNGLEIQEVEIRKVRSFGMICSEQELGLEEKSAGIMTLDSRAKIGTKFSQYQKIKEDQILEIDNKSLTHRSDLFGHIGIAQELGAIFNKKVNLPIIEKINIGKNGESLSVKVTDKKLCRRYMAVILDKIDIKPSPRWMQQRLSACGIKPINNVVDITNYVLLEFGQPLHAFDYDKIAGEKKSIIVRLARKNENIKTLDGKVRKLDKKDLVIADDKKAIALAGIMGASNSEVSKNTKKIILESANFDSYTVRKTAQRLSLRTEALTRFEKGLSPYFAEIGIKRAISLFKQYANAEIKSKIYDISAGKLKENHITLDIEKINQYLGSTITIKKVKSILTSLNFRISGTKNLKVTPPIYRNDIKIEEDVIEEVARIYGYDNIKPQTLSVEIKPVDQEKDIYWGNIIAKYLAGAGMNEVINYSFYGNKLLEKALISSDNHLVLENPISRDLNLLRTSLLPGLFQNIENNIKQEQEIKIFEIGHVYFEECECKALAGVVIGKTDNIFYHAKGIVETLFQNLNIEFHSLSLEKDQDCEYFNMYRDGTCLKYLSGNKMLGTISLADPRIIDNFDLGNKKLAFFNLSLDTISELANSDYQYKPLPKYPAVTMDLAIEIDQKVKAKKIKNLILKTGKPLLDSVELFDVYAGNKLGSNKKSLAYHLKFRSDKKTLNDEEVEQISKKIIKTLADKLGAKLRS